VVIFAMNVVGDRAPHRDKLGARSHRQKPAARNHDLENIGQGNAGFAAEQAGLLIERDETVEMADIERYAVLVETAIAITAPIGMRQH
jgi:hypothetical protein